MKNLPRSLLAALAILRIFLPDSVRAIEPTLEWPDRTIHIGARKYLACSIYLPDEYDPEREYPLVIGLHGYGSSPERFSAILEYLPKQSFILAVPEPPYPFTHEGKKFADGYSWDFRGDRSLWPEADSLTCVYIREATDSLRARFNTSRTILLGFSQGVSYAYAAAFKYIDDIDGVAAFSGRLPSPSQYPWLIDEGSIARSRAIRIFIAHGRFDEAVRFELSEKAEAFLESSGYEVRSLFFDGGHAIPPDALKACLEYFGIDSD